MGLKAFFQNAFGEVIDLFENNNESKEDFLQLLATAHAIDLIAKMIAKTEILVYRKDKKDKKIKETVDSIYYRLNLKPNYNENGTTFLYKLACRLILDQEALVIMQGPEKIPFLYVADSFNTTERILYPKGYKDITLSDSKGNTISLDKEYGADDVLYFSFYNSKIREATQKFKEGIGNLLKVALKSYKRKNVDKWRMKYPGRQPKILDPETGEELSNEKYKNKITDGLLTDEDVILLLSESFNLENLNKDRKQDASDIEKIYDLVNKETAMTFNIPLDIFCGTKTEKSTGTNDFITFAVDPVLENIEDGLNIGFIEEKDYIAGERIMFNRFNMQHKDVLDASTSIDKLTGARFSRNEINKFLRLPKIDEKWADEHGMTKNYGSIEGGEDENGG